MKSKKSSSSIKPPSCHIYEADDFGLRRKDFDAHALETVRVLQNAGFEAYIVGGGVRDQLLKLHPKDFDVATSAKPEEIKSLFAKCLIIGKRFRLAHVYFGRRELVEVATFRRDHSLALNEADARTHESGLISRDNVYGTLEEDTLRRDFTINAIYYNPRNHTLLDFSGGIDDFRQKTLRLIGDPGRRFAEDPVRILRAIRISNKIGFAIETHALTVMPQYIPLLMHVAGGRRFDEYQKMLLHGNGRENFKSLIQFDILPVFFARLDTLLGQSRVSTFIERALENTVLRYQEGKTIHPAFLLAVFLWPQIRKQTARLCQEGLKKNQAFLEACREALSAELELLSVPRFFVQMVRDVWHLQGALEGRRKNRIMKTRHHPKFRAAYDFLLLREAIGEVSAELANWWRVVQTLPQPEQDEMIKKLGSPERQGKKNTPAS